MPAPTPPSGPTIVASRCVLRVELADTVEKSTRGLSGRAQIPQDYGMLFPFSREGQLSIWMKGMLVPIDIVWMDREHRVLRVDAQAPVPPPGVPDYQLTIYNPPPTAMAVLEVAAGRAAACGLSPGATAQFVNIPGSQ